MSEVEAGGGGASDEELAEAEKFNEMVSEGKLSTSEVSQVGQSERPSDVSWEKERLNETRKMWEDSQTDRNLQEYCRDFGFKPEDLAGKKILDIGSGRKETFSKEASQFGAEVYSMTPLLREQYHRKLAKELLKSGRRWQKRSVAGRSQNIPFIDGIFDIITANWSVSAYTHGRELTLSLEEMLRVLKPDGEMYLTPIGDLATIDFFNRHKKDIETTQSDKGVLILKKKEDESK